MASVDLRTEFRPGVYHDIPAHQYHALPYWGSSAFKFLYATESPSKLIARQEKPPSPPTDAMVTGTAVHLAVLEPHHWQTAVEIVDQRRTKADKERILAAEAEGRLVLRQWQHETVSRIQHEVWTGVWADELRFLIECATATELTILFEFEGLKCKCRLDVWNEDLGVITDLKSMEDNSPRNVQRNIDYLDWPIQAALYLEGARKAGLSATSFVFAAIDKRPDGNAEVGLYELNSETLAAGLFICTKWARELKHAMETDIWRPARTGIQSVGMSDWQLRKVYE